MSSLLDSLINANYGVVIIIFLSVIFTVLVLFFYYQKDYFDPEPISHVLGTYFVGALLPVPVILLDIFLRSQVQNTLKFTLTYFLEAVLIAPILEETIKGLVIILLAKRFKFDSPFDGIIYGISVGSGFALTENVLFGLNALYQRGLSNAIHVTLIRGGIAFIGHPLYSGLVGFGVGAHQVGLYNNQYEMFKAAIVLHFIWNLAFILLQIFLPTSSFFLLIFSYIVTLISVFFITIVYFYTKLQLALDIEKQLYEKGYFEDKRQYRVYKI